MAITTDNQAKQVFKKTAAGKATSDPDAEFFGESVDSRLAVFSTQLWSASANIPETAPGATAGVVELLTDLSLTAIPGAAAAYTDASLIDVVPFNFGDGSYNYTLKKNDNSPIAFGQNDWYLDPESGVLTFFGGNPAGVSAGLPPKISCYKYVGPKGFPNGTAAITTTQSLQVWVNSVTGDDDNDGLSESTPKLTLEAGFDVLPSFLQHHCTVNLRGTFTPGQFFKIQKTLLGAILVIDGGPDTEVLVGPLTATGSSSTSVADSGQTWTTDQHAGLFVEILDGPAAGETRSIFSNDATTLVPNTAWSSPPGVGASFQISQPATSLTSGSARSLVMTCTPLNTFQNYPALQRITLKGNTSVFHIGGALIISGVVSRATGDVSYKSESPGVFFPLSFYTNPTTYAFDFVERTVPSFVGSGAIELQQHFGSMVDGGFILNGGSADFNRTALSNLSGTVSRIVSGGVSILNTTGNSSYEIEGASGVGLNVIGSSLNFASLKVDNCGSHAVEVNSSKLVHSSGASTGSGNTGAGAYIHSQGIVHTKSGTAPTITGTVGDVSLDSTTQKSTWAAIEGGTPINGATVGNDEFTIVKKV